MNKKEQKPKYVKCVLGGRRVEKGKVYEVVEQEYDEYYLRDGKRDVGWHLTSGFNPMPPTYDHVEEKVRAILTTPTDPHVCKKCCAPLPCAYHG